jgi:hypothetical protein
VAEVTTGSIHEAFLGSLYESCMILIDHVSGLLGEAMRAVGASKSSWGEKRVREVVAIGTLTVRDGRHSPKSNFEHSRATNMCRDS